MFIGQYSPKTGPGQPQDGPGQPQDGPGRPQDGPRWPPKSFQNAVWQTGLFDTLWIGSQSCYILDNLRQSWTILWSFWDHFLGTFFGHFWGHFLDRYSKGIRNSNSNSKSKSNSNSKSNSTQQHQQQQQQTPKRISSQSGRQPVWQGYFLNIFKYF